MKKLFYALLSFSILLLAGIHQKANAQVPYVLATSVTPTKASLSSADTAYAALRLDYTFKSVEAGATKTSGTVAGKVYFQGQTPDGSTYVNLDSLTVANSAGLQYKIFTVPTILIYQSYRFQFLSTGGVWAPTAYTLRRP